MHCKSYKHYCFLFLDIWSIFKDFFFTIIWKVNNIILHHVKLTFLHYLNLSSLFALLLVMAEFDFQCLLNNFGFLKFMQGKGIFCIFLGTLLFDNSGSGAFLGIILLIIGFVYICISCGVMRIVFLLIYRKKGSKKTWKGK